MQITTAVHWSGSIFNHIRQVAPTTQERWPLYWDVSHHL